MPVVHAEWGRDEHTARGYRPHPWGSRAGHGVHMREALVATLCTRSPRCVPGGVTPNPLRPDHERDEHAARGRGDGTVRGSRPRTWGAHDGHGLDAKSRVGLFYHPITITCGISGRLLVVDASALLRAHRGRGRLGDRRRPAPSAHT